MSTAQEIIDLWPTREILASDCGVTRGAIDQWCNRGFLPPKHWGGVLASARKNGIRKINFDLLNAVYAEKKRGGK